MHQCTQRVSRITYIRYTQSRTYLRFQYQPMSNPTAPNVQWYSCYSIFNLMFKVLQIIVCRCVLFPLAIVLSVLLRVTDSDYPFCIFKLFFRYVGMIFTLVSTKYIIQVSKAQIQIYGSALTAGLTILSETYSQLTS